jgi:hypothetical protein
MTDTMTSQNIDLSSWGILYVTYVTYFSSVRISDYVVSKCRIIG